MQPLVLAIEPDLRQAAIVKRIVREKVLADVTVVDSRDAALEAMRTTIPDVLLLSALLSPRDEDELFAHLRTLEHAEHLQTHTIPQLASSIEHDDVKPAKGLLSSLWRRKGSGAAPAGCDPDLFAEEIRTYLKRASEKRRELRDGGGAQTIAAIAGARASAADAPTRNEAPDPEPAASSWESPFEWRPSRGSERETRAPAAALVTADTAVATVDPVQVSAPEPAGADPWDVYAPEPLTVEIPDPGPAVAPQAGSILLAAPEPAVPMDPPAIVARKLPLVVRRTREWWYEEGEEPRGREPDSEVREVLASLTVPLHIAAIAYAEGCRIRRVRLPAA